MRFIFLLIAILFYSLAIGSVMALDNLKDDKNATFNYQLGGAIGWGIVASTLILCGSFFLYRFLTISTHLQKKEAP